MKRFNTAIIYTIVGLLLLGTAILSFVYLNAYTEAPARSQSVVYPPVVVNPPTVGEIHLLANQEREQAGLAPLVLNVLLNEAATAKANHMLLHDYWAHNAPDGTTPWTFIQNVGYKYKLAGENLAEGFATSEDTVNGWMNSPDHRENLLKPTYNEVGYAVIDGTLKGEKTTLVVAMYAQSY